MSVPSTLTPGQARRVYWSLRISGGGNYVYKSVPKCGCSTVKRALWWAETRAGRFDAPYEAAFDGAQLHAIGEGTPFTNDPSAFREGMFAFAVVRNPYERIHSAYVDKCVFAPMFEPATILMPLRDELGVGSRDVSLTEFLAYVAGQPDDERDPHWMSMTGLVADDVVRTDYLGALETLADDMSAVFAHIFPEQAPELVNANARRVSVAAPAPTGAELETIARLYEADFEAFGYSLDPARSEEPPRKRGPIA